MVDRTLKYFKIMLIMVTYLMDMTYMYVHNRYIEPQKEVLYLIHVESAPHIALIDSAICGCTPCI